MAALRICGLWREEAGILEPLTEGLVGRDNDVAWSAQEAPTAARLGDGFPGEVGSYRRGFWPRSRGAAWVQLPPKGMRDVWRGFGGHNYGRRDVCAGEDPDPIPTPNRLEFPYYLDTITLPLPTPPTSCPRAACY